MKTRMAESMSHSWRSVITNTMVIGGWMAAVVGIGLWSVAAAMVVGGVSLATAGVLMAREETEQ